MNRRLGVFVLAGLLPWGSAQLCRVQTYQQAPYTVCTVDVRRDALRLFWQDSSGKPYGSFRRLEETLGGQGKRLAFAMNAGMFDPARAPVGLYIEKGRQLRALVLSEGPGSFHLKPNGVFYGTGKRVGVLESGQYARLKPMAVFATQSGPMLVIGGKIHPRLLPGGDSFKIRNGVGVPDPYTAVFVISSQPVNFYTFATFFRDALGCKDALYLDGSISSLYSPEVGRADGLFPLGPIIGVVR